MLGRTVLDLADFCVEHVLSQHCLVAVDVERAHNSFRSPLYTVCTTVTPSFFVHIPLVSLLGVLPTVALAFAASD